MANHANQLSELKKPRRAAPELRCKGTLFPIAYLIPGTVSLGDRLIGHRNVARCAAVVQSWVDQYPVPENIDGVAELKLQHDLIREILLGIEEHWKARQSNWVLKGPQPEPRSIFDPLIETHGSDVVLEHLVLLEEAGYVRGNLERTLQNADFFLEGLSMRGHEFIENVADEKIWRKARAKANEVASSVSISVLGELAKKVLLDSL